MSLEDRLAKAKKLAELMDMYRENYPMNPSVDPKKLDFKKSFEEKSKEYHIELRAKHMTDEQLDALIGFYETEMGTSIIKSGARITKEFKENVHKRLSSPPPSKGESGWIRHPGVDNEEDDT